MSGNSGDEALEEETESREEVHCIQVYQQAVTHIRFRLSVPG